MENSISAIRATTIPTWIVKDFSTGKATIPRVF